MKKIVIAVIASVFFSSLASACGIEIRPPVTHCFKEGPYQGHAIYFASPETGEDGEKIFHVSVQGPFKVSTGNGVKIIPIFGHMPFSKDAIDKTSLIECDVEFSPNNMLQQGIATWREQKGGVYSIPIDDAVTIGLETMTSKG